MLVSGFLFLSSWYLKSTESLFFDCRVEALIHMLIAANATVVDHQDCCLHTVTSSVYSCSLSVSSSIHASPPASRLVPTSDCIWALIVGCWLLAFFQGSTVGPVLRTPSFVLLQGSAHGAKHSLVLLDTPCLLLHTSSASAKLQPCFLAVLSTSILFSPPLAPLFPLLPHLFHAHFPLVPFLSSYLSSSAVRSALNPSTPLRICSLVRPMPLVLRRCQPEK